MFFCQNAAAKLIFKQPKFCRITPVLCQLHWLPWPSSIALSLRFYLCLLKLFTACTRLYLQIDQPKEINRTSDPAKKLFLKVQAAIARYSRHLVVEPPVMRPQSSRTTFLVKYPALTLCQILNALWKNIFLSKLLICSRVFVSFILLFIIYYHFNSFLNPSTCLLILFSFSLFFNLL